MVMCRGLLWVSVVMLVPACTGLPTKDYSRRDTISNIVNIAQTTLVRISQLNLLPPSPQIIVASPPIRGLNSISQDLSRLGDQFQDAALGSDLGQIHEDVSSLKGSVHFLVETMGCLPTDHAETGETSLASKDFSESLVYESLMKVEAYLNKLLLNEDKLSAC